jgi:hypothetical protein
MEILLECLAFLFEIVTGLEYSVERKYMAGAKTLIKKTLQLEESELWL